MTRPAFRVVIDGQHDVTEAIRERLLSLAVSDRAGWESDTCRIRVDDTGGSIELPRRGAELAVSMGYEGGLRPMGRFTCDEVTASGPPAEIAVTARAADFRDTLKAQRTRSWDDTSLGAIASSIAREHGLREAVEGSLAAVAVPHLDQHGESDIAFVSRLAEERGGTATVAAGRLLVTPAGGGTSASGSALAPIAIALDGVTRYRAVLADRPRYGSVDAEWHSAAKGRRMTERAGSGTPTYRLPWLYAGPEDARQAARAKLDSLTRATATLRLEMPGDSRILSGTPLTLDGFRAGLPRTWTSTRVEHVLDRRGYTTRADAEQAP